MQTSQVIETDNISEVVEKEDKVIVEDVETQRLKQENAALSNEIQYLKENLEMAERTVKQESELRKEETRMHENRMTQQQQEI